MRQTELASSHLFVVQDLTERGFAISYQAVGTVGTLEAVVVARSKRMRRLMGWWVRSIDEVKWQSVT